MSSPARPIRDKALDTRAKLLFGVSVICGMFVLETATVHSQAPNPASPYIWAALGAVGIGSLVYGVWCWRKARA